MISGGSAKARSKAFAISSPRTGSTCRLRRSISARNAGSTMVASNAARSSRTRSAGTPGGSHHRPVEALGEHDEVELLAGRLILDELHHGRRVREFRAALLRDQDRHLNLALAEPVRPR